MSDIIDQIKEAKVEVFRPYYQYLLFVTNKDRQVDLREIKGTDRIVVNGLSILKLSRIGKRVFFAPCDEATLEYYQGDKPSLMNNHFLHQFLSGDLVFAEREELVVAVIRDWELAEKLLRH